jgi:hypothetical protein
MINHYRKAHILSSIPPSFTCTTVSDVFLITVPVNDPDVVEFLSLGVREVLIHGPRLVAKWMVDESFQGQLYDAVWHPAKLKPIGIRMKTGLKIEAFCHGVFLLPDQKNLCVVVGRAKPVTTDAWISSQLKSESIALLIEHQIKVAEFNEAMKLKEKSNNDFFGSNAGMEKYENVADAFLAMEKRFQAPILTIERLLHLLPFAAKLRLSALGDPNKIVCSALAAILASNWAPSREGSYSCLIPSNGNSKGWGLVTWLPHKGMPSYPEVRWAVQKRLPCAFRKPRISNISKPQIDAGSQPIDETLDLLSFELDATNLNKALENIELNQNDYRNRVDDVRRGLSGQGFEAIAWFQPYHLWTEETWGIYFDACALDNLALSFIDECKSQSINISHSLAAQLAFGLTLEHELFHAKVEAAVSWLELNTLDERLLRYLKNVYQALRGTSLWLEEALANWSAWHWFNKAPGMQAELSLLGVNAQSLASIVDTHLDLSPEGYREWRLGHRAAIWRIFTNELITGSPEKSTNIIGLPTESLLTGPLPYDFKQSDIPMYFVGSGDIANSLLSHPATFHVPPRRELEKALKHFKHSLNAAGGKGGHQKWTGPDQRAFILPTRDPVSSGVFKEFLHHVGINKAEYVQVIRPNL